MDFTKDYYAILGVLPSIDQDALKAVYHALMKKFHPDIYSGSKIEAEAISVSINEAYSILGNSELRARYDSKRGEKNSQAKGQYDSQRETNNTESALTDTQKEAWQTILEFQPIVLMHHRDLEFISPSLALQFQITIIEQKLSYEAAQVRNVLEEEFFLRYFGNNRIIRDFVKQCIVNGRKSVAKEINRAIRILGSPNTDSQAREIIAVASKKVEASNAHTDSRTHSGSEESDSNWTKYKDPESREYKRMIKVADLWNVTQIAAAKALSLGITSSLLTDGRIFEIDPYSAQSSIGFRGRNIFHKSGKNVLRDRNLNMLIRTVEELLQD